jgi:predicted RNA-binding Zn ribbon-like protein
MAMKKNPTAPRRVELEDALDFINTLEHERDGDLEHLPTGAAAAAWLADHGALSAGRVEVDDRGLESTRAVRRAMRELADAVVDQRAPDHSAIDRLNELLRVGDAPRLVASSTGVVGDAEHRADPLTDALAHLVEPLVELVRSGDPDRLRVCDNEHCRWVFYDGSRTGRRRWCSMGTCGNRAKAARHRARLRSKEPATAG